MLNEQLLWQAVVERDSRWDGAFVYAVTSTRIYCRPTCPSRRPHRDRVTFFAAAAAAEQAGFRACRRCGPSNAETESPAIARVRRVCMAIARRPDVRLTLPMLARTAKTSPHHLLRTFKQVLGITPREYASACREGCLRARLRDARRVTDATYEAGYGSGSRVYERSNQTLGMTPRTYAGGASGVTVRYAIVDGPLGHLLVAATSRGVCSIKLGDSAQHLERELRAEYPHAILAPADDDLAAAIVCVIDSLKPGAPDPRLPTDLRATAFQRLVWRELQRIPRGETRTYRQVAEAIGQPAAVRAVARACATNPVAVVVPCHRVVRADGTLSGYRWGAARKGTLLLIERGGISNP